MCVCVLTYLCVYFVYVCVYILIKVSNSLYSLVFVVVVVVVVVIVIVSLGNLRPILLIAQPDRSKTTVSGSVCTRP